MHPSPGVDDMTMPTGAEKIPFSDNLHVVFFFTFTISCWNVAERHQWKQKKGSLLNMSILLFLILTLISNWRIFEIHMKSLYVRWKKEAKICNFEIHISFESYDNLLSESLDQKIQLVNKFHHKMSLNFCHGILTREIHVKFFLAKSSEKPPKKGF